MLGITRVLLFVSLIIFPFGNILRFQVVPGVNVSFLDCVVGLLLLVNVNGIQSFIIKRFALQRAVRDFIIVAGISLCINAFWLGPMNSLIASLYLLRLVAYLHIFVVLLGLDQKSKSTLSYGVLASGALFVLFGLTQYLLYPNLRNLYYLGWDEHLYRLFGTVFDPNFAGAVLLIVLAKLLSLFSWKKLYRSKLLLTGIGLTLIAVFLTYSRSTFVALTAGLLAYAVRLRSWMVVLVGCFAIVSALFILPKGLGGEGVNLMRTASGESRLREYSQAIHVWADRPIFGVGFNAYRFAQLREGYINVEGWQENHAGAGVPNMYLFVLATTGAVGFILFLRVLYYAGYEAFASMQPVYFALIAALYVHGLFENTLFYSFILYYAIMTLGTWEKVQSK